MSDRIHPKLSVIIPVYNVEEFLHECIDSVLKQSFKDYEIILVNDGSTDSSGEICNNYAKSNKNVTVFHVKNSGAARARNIGLNNSSGKYLMFLDSDDSLQNHNFLREIFIKKDVNKELIFFGIDKYFNDKNKKIKYSLKAKLKYRDPDYDLQMLVNKKIYISSVCNKIFSRIFLENENIQFREYTIAEDILFSGIVLTKDFDYYYHADNNYLYRQHKNSITNNIKEKEVYQLADNLKILFNLYDLDGILYRKAFRAYLSYQFGVYIVNLIKGNFTITQSDQEFVNRYKKILKYSGMIKLKLILFMLLNFDIKKLRKAYMIFKSVKIIKLII